VSLPKPVEAPAEPGGPTIKEATDAFLARCQNRGIRRTTFAKHRTFVRQLIAYAEARGYTRVDRLTVVDMDPFYALWSDGIRSRAKKLERLKSFVRFCKKRNWLAEDITEDLEAPQGASVNLPKTPFTDVELERIFSALRHNWRTDQAGTGLPNVVRRRRQRLHLPLELYWLAHPRCRRMSQGKWHQILVLI
jgi:site-specific recombinase XerD